MSEMRSEINWILCLGVFFCICMGCQERRERKVYISDDSIDDISTTLIEDIEEQRIHLSKQAVLRKRKIDSLNHNLDWELLPCGLYRNKFKDLGFKVNVALAKEIFVDMYLLEFNGMNDLKPLKSVIDTSSFRYLGNSFYQDKKHIYQYFEMRDGGFLTIFTIADYPSFAVLGDCFAKDKNHVYSERSGIIQGADAKTFTTTSGIGCFAKDKNGYYFWNTPIKAEDMDLDIVRKLEDVARY